MPPDPQAPDPQEKTSKPATTPGQVDVNKILLPKKEAPGTTIQSARRVSAGALLDQELKAGSGGFAKTAGTTEVNGGVPAAKQKPKEDSSVQPLETYQADIEKVMQGGDTSIISIAAAEAQRRARSGGAQTPLPPVVPLRERVADFFKKFSMVGGGIVLLLIASGVLAYVFLRPTTVPVATQPPAPFMSVDATQFVSITADDAPRTLVTKLSDAKGQVALSLGLIERLVPSIASTTQNGPVTTPMDAQTFMTILGPHMPADLLRTLEPTYLLGAHVYDQNQPLLILSVDSYEQAYSGMLAWESDMQSDLAPLFTFVPSPHITSAPSVPVIATSTATSTGPAAPPPPIQPKFIDQIVENHDARVIQNSSGDIYLLWTFLDRNTLVITTNAATLREIISRFQEAPVTALPPQ